MQRIKEASWRRGLKSFLLLLGFQVALYPHNSITKPLDIIPSSISDDLASKTVIEMFRDRQGFLWLRNHLGLSRFDGHRLRKIYSYRAAMSGDGLWSNSRMAQDQNRVIWFASLDAGLLQYDADSRSFIPFEPNFYEEISGPATIYYDDARSLWIGGHEGDLIRIDTVDYTHYSTSTAENFLSRGDRIVSFSKYGPDTLWIASHKGTLLKCNSLGNDCTYFHVKDFSAIPSEFQVQSILATGKDVILLSLYDGSVFQLSTKSKNLGQSPQRRLRFSVKPAYNNTGFFRSGSGDIWLGTTDGLYRFSDENDVERYYKNNSGLSDSLVYSLIEDSKGNLLVGSFSGIYSAKSSLFKKYDNSSELPSKNVTAFAQADDGTVFVGTLGGVSIIGNPDTKILPLTARFPWLRVSDPRVTSLSTSNQELWLGFYSTGVQRVNLSKERQLPIDNEFIKEPAISASKRLTNGAYAVSTYGSGIFIFDRTGKLILNADKETSATAGLLSESAYCIEQISQNKILVGTTSGFSQLTLAWEARERAGVSSSIHHLSNHRIYSLRLTSNGDVYAGTGSDGVYRWRSALREDREPVIERVNTSPPLPDQTIYAIEEDDQGMLWMSTNKGLVRLNPANDQITIFDRSDGLQDDEFNIGSSFKDSSGNLYFGGINGFNKFNPKEVKIKREPPRINVTEIKITNTPVPYDPGYADIQEIVLRHDDHSIDFEFSNMDLVSPGRGHYKYMLQNFDSDWIDIGNRNTATYTSLPSGNYRFRVVGANADGVWNYDGVSIRLRVLPAPWFTWWSFTAYGLAALAVLLFIKRFYEVNIVKDEATRQASVMTKTATRAMDELQDQLFVERRLVGNVRKHAASLIDAIEEMMAVESEELGDGASDEPLRRTRQRLHCLKALEQGVCFHADRLEVNFRDVADAIFEEVMADAPLTECEIVFANDSIERLIPVEIATALTLITHELVLNGVTHAFEDAEGVQVVVVSLKENADSAGWSLEVADSGCGLPGNITPMQPSTLGMELVNCHARRLGATFEVTVDKGTRYRFQVPAPAATHSPFVLS